MKKMIKYITGFRGLILSAIAGIFLGTYGAFTIIMLLNDLIFNK